MTRTVALSEFMPYGAPELQSVARPYLARALLLSTVLTTFLVAALGLVRTFAGLAPAGPAPIVIDIGRIPPPASLATPVQVHPVAPAARRHASAAVPLPVPDAQASAEATIAAADELRTALPGIGTGDAPLIVEQPAAVETLPALHTYVYVEDLPVPVHSVHPEYPALAREAGVSGLVVAHLLVGRDGRVLDVRVDGNHSILMLNEAALRAARQWAFTPALVNGKPVAVWVAVPFNFRLQ